MFLICSYSALSLALVKAAGAASIDLTQRRKGAKTFGREGGFQRVSHKDTKRAVAAAASL
jgi:hypothetical protein